MDRPHPRFAVGGRIRCHLEPHNISLTLVTVGRDGFVVRAPMKSRVGDVHRIRFRVEGQRDAIFVLSARVVHCTESVASPAAQYLIGMEFIDTNTQVSQRAIAHLVGVASN
jgi:hypothetical protein